MEHRVNGRRVDATEFFFDGCHKIYIPDGPGGYDRMYGAGWDDGDLYPIDELPAVWAGTCPLRFISSADDLSDCYVRQFEPARFDGWSLDGWLQDELALMAAEQEDANRRAE